ncbi:hypothetical protein PLESTF_001893000, partial [Pleodorina starrii]
MITAIHDTLDFPDLAAGLPSLRPSCNFSSDGAGSIDGVGDSACDDDNGVGIGAGNGYGPGSGAGNGPGIGTGGISAVDGNGAGGNGAGS